MEAFDGYYRPVNVKQLVMTSVPEGATRVAMLERGEADIIYSVPGELVSRVQKLPGVTLAPVLSGSWFLEFPGFQDPKSPFRDKRVREAVSLAIDRRAMNQAESAGFGKVSGNWINNDVQYALEWPEIERNVERAKQLLREAGYANGFDVAWVTPLPAWYSRGVRVIGQLREDGIRAGMQNLERGVFVEPLPRGLEERPGRRLLYSIVTLLILSATIFVIVRLTGDPVSLLAEAGARPEDLERIHRQWGLDRSWPVQYVSFLQNIVTGELGKSFNYRLPVSELYFQRLPKSLTLGLVATLISILVGVPAVIISVVKVT